VWGWERKDALALYGLYTGLVHLTPIIGGYIADQLLGSRRSVFLGCLIIAAGHVCLSIGLKPAFFFGLVLMSMNKWLDRLMHSD